MCLWLCDFNLAISLNFTKVTMYLLLNDVDSNKSHPNQYLIQWQSHTTRAWASSLNGMWLPPILMEDLLLQELLQIADSEAPGELWSSDLQLLAQQLRITMEECGESWELLHSCGFSECIWTAEESYLYHPYWTHWEDELSLQASEALPKGQEEDSLSLATSQDY